MILGSSRSKQARDRPSCLSTKSTISCANSAGCGSKPARDMTAPGHLQCHLTPSQGYFWRRRQRSAPSGSTAALVSASALFAPRPDSLPGLLSAAAAPTDCVAFADTRPSTSSAPSRHADVACTESDKPRTAVAKKSDPLPWSQRRPLRGHPSPVDRSSMLLIRSYSLAREWIR